MTVTPKLGFKVATRPDAIILTVPQTNEWPSIYFGGLSLMMIWLIVASFFGKEDANSGPQIPAGLVYLGAVGFSLIAIGFWTDKITVKRTATELIISRYFFGLPSNKHFFLKDIRNLHVYGPTKDHKGKAKFQVLFHYGQDTITVAKRLTQPKANLIIETLMNHH